MSELRNLKETITIDKYCDEDDNYKSVLITIEIGSKLHLGRSADMTGKYNFRQLEEFAREEAERSKLGKIQE